MSGKGVSQKVLPTTKRMSEISDESNLESRAQLGSARKLSLKSNILKKIFIYYLFIRRRRK